MHLYYHNNNYVDDADTGIYTILDVFTFNVMLFCLRMHVIYIQGTTTTVYLPHVYTKHQLEPVCDRLYYMEMRTKTERKEKETVPIYYIKAITDSNTMPPYSQPLRMWCVC